MYNAVVERFALENDLELDEVINFFRGLDKPQQEDLD